jgi:hypothetical protein
MDTNKLPEPNENVTTFTARMSNALRQDITVECWRSIDEYVNYQVSNMGRVRNVTTGKILKQHMNTWGYYAVVLYKESVQKNLCVHRLVANEFLHEPDHESKLVVDHIDRNKLNNYVTNLRYATRQQNGMNNTKRKNTSSIYKGVMFYKRYNKWMSHIRHKGKRIHLGYFVDDQDAARAYNAKAMELFGEYANLNIVD